MFFGLKDSLLAIDIGTNSIKIMDLPGKNSKKLKSMGYEVLPKGLIENGVITDPDQVTQILKDMVKRLGIRKLGKEVSLSLSGNATIIKTLKFPNKSDFELADLIESELEQHFQIDLKELYFSWHIQRTESDSEEEVVVIIVGAKKDIVDRNIEVIKDVGFGIGIIDCDIFATSNILNYSYENLTGLHLILNIGEFGSQISFIGDSNFIYSREIPIGGSMYTQKIASLKSVDFDKAENLKIEFCKNPQNKDETIDKVLSEVHDELVHELNTNVQFYLDSEENIYNFNKIDAIYLTGGGSLTKGLTKNLKDYFNVPIEVLNPFKNIKVPSKFPQESIDNQKNYFGVVAGLALRMSES